MNGQASYSSRWLKILRILGTLGAVGLLIYLLMEQGWSDIGRAIAQVPPVRFGEALLLMILSRLAVTARWHSLLRTADVKISYWQSFKLTLAGLFASNFLPSTIGGDVVRLAGALKYQCSAALSAASLIVDRFIGMAGMALFLPVGLTRLLAPNPKTYLEYPTLFVPLAMQSPEWWNKIKGTLSSVFHELTEALTTWIKLPGSLLIGLLFSGIHMMCFFGIFSLFFSGMGENISFWLIGGLYCLSYFVTLIPISINGYGLQEISLTFVFYNLAGISMSSSLTVALLFRTLTMLVSLPGAVFMPDILSKPKALS